MIEFFRIDDRLIHGQIATTWIRHVGPTAVVLADDKTAGNNLLISLQKMSAPKDFPLHIFTVDDAVEQLNGLLAGERVFLLVGSVAAAHKLALACAPKKLNLGNLGYKDGYDNLIKRLFVSKEDKRMLGEIVDAGVGLYAQMLPSDAVSDINAGMLA